MVGTVSDRLIVLPPSFNEQPVFKCNVPGCKTVFYAGQERAYQRHVGVCARRNIDRIRAELPSEQNKGTIFDTANNDVELEQHFKGVWGRMKEEGRMEVKPNEAAGLS